jgi:hypothetical protein
MKNVCTHQDGAGRILTTNNTILSYIGVKKETDERTFTISEDMTVYIIIKLFDGEGAFMIRPTEITDSTYEPYIDDIDTRLKKFEQQLRLFNSSGGNSPQTITINNLFVDYSAVICNIVTSSGKYNLTLPLKYIKSLGSSAYYEVETLLFYYVDDNTLTIKTGLGQSNPNISKIEIISLY